MDALDLVAARLAEVLGAGGRGDPGRSVEIAELFQTLVPYRRVREEARIDSAEEYELVLLRLIAGERGYVTGDPAMQERVQLELQETVPDLSLYRAYARSHVQVVAEKVPRVSRSVVTPSAVADPSMGRVAPTAPADFAPKRAADAPPIRPSFLTAAPATPPVPPAAPVPPIAAEADVPTPSQKFVTASDFGGRCRYCSQELPDGRKLHYCPHCGQDLTVRQCPACSSELEIGWKFCTTCGRTV